MIKHKIWITKNNYSLAKERLGKFNRYNEEAKKLRKKLGITFYLPEDENIKTNKEPVKDVIIIKKIEGEIYKKKQ
jgi:signal-transduction protein with cAMP-binding, CBS, and nucleotidyltransferase domain